MKKHYLFGILSIALFFTLAPYISHAEDTGTGTGVSGSGSGSGSVDAPVPDRSIPPPPAFPPGTSPSVREKMLNDYKMRMQNLRTNVANNQEYRNEMMSGRGKLAATTTATSTRPRELRADMHAEVRTMKLEGRADIREMKQENRKDMRIELFRMHKEMLVKQLQMALSNLKQIRTRINTRIEKATTEGKDMTEAKTLLVTADAKLTLAEQAIAAVVAYTPPSTASASSTATTTVDLIKPRQLGANAIKALRDARMALNAVVRAIAKGLGVTLPPPPPEEPTDTSAPLPENQVQ